MATVDDVTRTLITLMRHEGATKTSVMRGLKAEYKHVPPQKLQKLIIAAGAKISKAVK